MATLACCCTPCEGTQVEEAVATRTSHEPTKRPPFDVLAEEDIESLHEESTISPEGGSTVAPGYTYEVEVDRGTEMAGIGLQLEVADPQLCLVAAVKGDGMVAQWNATSALQQVVSFDRLLKVNGETGTASELVAKACASRRLVLSFQRPRSFQVRIHRKGRPLGLRIAVNSERTSSIAVSQVEADGAVEDWNRRHPSLALQQGDRILDVLPAGEPAFVEQGTATAEAAGVLKTLQTHDDVCLTVLSWRQ
mmetsp:Transcript_5826/g.10492  ORF Transcript_5826/g.10492 Transcript_5826/m.10492 type:complete len:250 (+) Transcript_5826:81-830(+)